MENFALFLVGRGLTLGVSAAALPGPLQGYIINTALKHGWRRTLYVIVCPLIVDIPIIFAVLLALQTMETVVPRVVDGVRIVGGLFVLYLALGVYRDFQAGVGLTDTAEQGPAAQETRLGTFTRGLLLNALSPGPYLFWTTVNGPLLLSGLERAPIYGVSFLLAFYGTFLSLYIALAMAMDRVRALDDRLTRGLLLVVMVLMAFVGVWLVIEGVFAFVNL